MAQIEESGSGRKSTFEVNLVPFIDLMSVCIIFLLITAVWTQVSMIQLGSSMYGKKTALEATPPPPRAEIPFRVDVLKTGHRIVIGRQSMMIGMDQGRYDLERLRLELRKVKETYPDKEDAVITVLDELPYESLVDGMDALLNAGFPEISVATSGVE